MKKLIYLFVISIFIISCKKEAEADYVLLSGKIENSEAKEINITGHKFKKSIPVNEDGSFADTLYLEAKGYYTFTAGERANLFLKNGYEINLTINAKEFDESITYTGKGAAPNNYMAAKLLMEEKLQEKPEALYTLEEEEFKTKAQAHRGVFDSLLTAAGQESDFEKLEKENIFYAYATALARYPSYHEYYAEKEDFKPGENFYDELKDINDQDESIYIRIPSYKSFVAQKLSERFGENNEKYESYSKAFLASIENLPKGEMKDDLMNRYIGFCLTTDENMDTVYNTYMAEAQNEEYKAKVEEKYRKLLNLVKGKPSPVFAYENHKGGKTSLEDLKGKYVYIDVWATWCGPCKAEIPHLKQLEKDYHNSNIAFVSISIDTPNAYETWKKMVVEKELVGIQLIADNNWSSKFVTDYAIEGIPRFILIDPDGNIISSDAPRPSNEKIRSLFKELKI